MAQAEELTNWLDIYTQFNKDSDELEIIAVGEHNGEALKAWKSLPYKEIK